MRSSRVEPTCFLAATNRDLEAEVARGAFREDLYYRLNAVVVAVPPLRERIAEIAPLAIGFARAASRALAHPDEPTIAPAAMDLLLRYTWPGNIRELRNVIERAVLLAPGGAIGLEHLPHEKMGRTLPSKDGARETPSEPDVSVDVTVSRAPEALTRPPGPSSPEDDRLRIATALEQCFGNQTHAARLLGISRRTLISRLDTYGLPRPRKR